MPVVDFGFVVVVSGRLKQKLHVMLNEEYHHTTYSGVDGAGPALEKDDVDRIGVLAATASAEADIAIPRTKLWGKVIISLKKL